MNAAEIRNTKVPPGRTTIWWLGQGGFVIKSPGGTVIVIDPYLSDSCKALGEEAGYNLARMAPPPITPADLMAVDLYVMTHSHRDHLDPETVAAYRAAGGHGPYYAPAETVEMLHGLGVPVEETIMTWPNKVHVIGDITLRTTFAIPSAPDDLTHVGYLVTAAGCPTIYFTGDTSYDPILAITVRPYAPEAMVCVINGGFRNMGPADAARLARELNVKVTIPSHFELFADNCQPPHMLLTNLKNEGIGRTYRLLQCGVPYTYPE